MTSKPLVSVIIPVYNRLSLLKEAVDSAAAQSHRNVELIITDDGSTDGTGEYCREVAAKEEQIRYLRLDHTGMPGAVRNRGAEASRGMYLAFLDSDDLWLPEKIEKQVAVMGRSRDGDGRLDGEFCRISHTRERWMRRNAAGTLREISQTGQKHRRSGDIFEDALKKCIIGPSTVMMERALFEEAGGFREDMEVAEDYEFWLRVTARERICYIDEPLTIKRAGHSGQLSEKYGHIEYFRLIGLKGLVDSGRFRSAPRESAGGGLSAPHRIAALRELARKCRIYAAGCRKRGRAEEAVQYEEWAVQYEQEAAELELS